MRLLQYFIPFLGSSPDAALFLKVTMKLLNWYHYCTFHFLGKPVWKMPVFQKKWVYTNDNFSYSSGSELSSRINIFVPIEIFHFYSNYLSNLFLAFRCHVCKKRFRLEISLKKHIQVDCGKPKIPCTLCKYSTTRRSNLRRHMYRHWT